MPYTLKEKQRKFQRDWARKKAEGLREIRSRSIVTWGDLQELNFIKEIKTYQECVEVSKTLTHGHYINRFAIAEACIQASRIQHGGDRRSEFYLSEESRPTIIKFARDAGVHSKTLNDWVRAKVLVIDQLPPETPIADYSTAKLVIDHYKKFPELSMIELYTLFRSDSALRDAKYAWVSSRTVLRFLVRRKTKALPKAWLKEIKENVERSHQLLLAHEKSDLKSV